MSDGHFAMPAPGKPPPARRSSSRAIKRKTYDDEWVNSPTTTKVAASKNLGVAGPSSTAGVLPPGTPTGPSASGASFAELGVAAMSYSAPPAAAASRRHKDLATATPGPSPVGTPVSGLAGPSGIGSVPSSRQQKSKNKKKVKGKKKQTAVFELGRFKPTDDLALINGVLQTNDLEIVHKCVKFSCKFTLAELQERWYSLLYDECLSTMAVQAIHNLHPETVATVQSKALFSRKEENLLAGVGFSEARTPVLAEFQDLLRKHPDVFHRGRSAKSLMNHWNQMKTYELLQCQNGSRSDKSNPRSFYDLMSSVNDSELPEQSDEAAAQELQIQSRCVREEIKRLEEDVRHWESLSKSVTGQSVLPSFEDGTVAIVKGRVVNFRMENREATFGRSVKGSPVDIDLSLEGPAGKISRRQGTIKLRKNGDFYIQNEGRRAFFVDGKPVLPNHKFKLHDNAVIQLCRFIRLVFRVNEDLVGPIRESAKESKGSAAKKQQKLKQEEGDSVKSELSAGGIVVEVNPDDGADVPEAVQEMEIDTPSVDFNVLGAEEGQDGVKIA